MTDQPASSADIYVETNVLRYFQTAITDPAPPADRASDVTAADNWVAAVCLFLYAPNRNWRLWVSDTVHEELDRRDKEFGDAGWAEPLFSNLDAPHGAPPAAAIDDLATAYLDRFGRPETSNHRNDMRHLARLVLVKWLSGFVTNDRQLREDARSALATDAPERAIAVYSPVEAVAALRLGPDEQPRYEPAPGNPLRDATWWRHPGAGVQLQTRSFRQDQKGSFGVA
jgi:hypothetical protein